MTLPTELDSTHRSKIDKLKSLKSADFSSGYQIEQMAEEMAAGKTIGNH